MGAALCVSTGGDGGCGVGWRVRQGIVPRVTGVWIPAFAGMTILLREWRFFHGSCGSFAGVAVLLRGLGFFCGSDGLGRPE